MPNEPINLAEWFEAHREEEEARMRRMENLVRHFEGLTVAQMLEDLHWLSQYLIYKHHVEEERHKQEGFFGG